MYNICCCEVLVSYITYGFQVPMTGLQAKRKREDEESLQDLPAAKFRGRGWPEPRLGRLEACDPWSPEDDSPPESEEEDDEDEELEDLGSRVGKAPSNLYRSPYPCYTNMDNKPYFNGEPCSEHGSTQNYGVNYRAPAAAEPYCPPPRFARTTTPQQQYWPSPQYCYPSDSPTPPPPNNQTIRCAENGKSYLELGASPTITNSNNNSIKYSRTANYRQQRLAVLNISMCKLSRFRQFPDPSLHRSVLICNTLRRIEREMEHDSQFFCSEPPPTSSTPGPINYPSAPSYPATPPPPEIPHYEHSLRDVASPAPRATPFPSPAHPGSDNDSASSINWGSVLSLSSQSDLDPLNNNSGGGSTSLLLDDLDCELPSWRLTPLSADEVLKSVPPEPRTVIGEELVDSLMHVLVGT